MLRKLGSLRGRWFGFLRLAGSDLEPHEDWEVKLKMGKTALLSMKPQVAIISLAVWNLKHSSF